MSSSEVSPERTLTVPLSQGLVAVIDAADFARVSQFKWTAQRCRNICYAIRWVRGVSRGKHAPEIKRRRQSLHAFIIEPPEGSWVDHWNHDGLLNTRGNLRLVTPSQNAANRRKQAGTSSQYKGVTRLRTGKWQAHIRANGVYRCLGAFFTSEEDAARMYNRAAVAAFGEFALINAVDP